MTLLVVPDTTHDWATTPDTKAMIVRISCLASLEARHRHIGLLDRMLYDLRHHHAHEQLSTNS